MVCELFLSGGLPPPSVRSRTFSKKCKQWGFCSEPREAAPLRGFRKLEHVWERGAVAGEQPREQDVDGTDGGVAHMELAPDFGQRLPAQELLRDAEAVRDIPDLKGGEERGQEFHEGLLVGDLRKELRKLCDHALFLHSCYRCCHSGVGEKGGEEM